MNSMDVVKSILALTRSGANADEPDDRREHFLAIAEITRKGSLRDEKISELAQHNSSDR